MKLFNIKIDKELFEHYKEEKNEFTLFINSGTSLLFNAWHINLRQYGKIYIDWDKQVIGKVESPIMLTDQYWCSVKFKFDKESTIEDIKKTIEDKLNNDILKLLDNTNEN